VAITSLNSHFPPGNSPQDIEKKKAEPKTPHFLSLKQDMVACSQEGKWGLKYVICILQTKGRVRHAPAFTLRQ